MNITCSTTNTTQDAECTPSRDDAHCGSVTNRARRSDSYIIPPVPRTKTKHVEYKPKTKYIIYRERVRDKLG